jgi:hypothetical protein
MNLLFFIICGRPFPSGWTETELTKVWIWTETALLDAEKETDLEENFCHKNAGQKHSINIANRCFEKWGKVETSGNDTNQDGMQRF